MVHGTGATRQQWLPLTEAVADRFTVVAPDYSGSGGTIDHGGPLTLPPPPISVHFSRIGP
ncbi:alpha/beta fold hydrolase [Streptomyces sp. RGM 3693]|uniref:alpha/beta fold hydrolase n=1 Tax=Streptomyces sp. RGM 3693 TaxID=3413284 RepID=UPI003D28DDEB